MLQAMRPMVKIVRWGTCFVIGIVTHSLRLQKRENFRFQIPGRACAQPGLNVAPPVVMIAIYFMLSPDISHDTFHLFILTSTKERMKNYFIKGAYGYCCTVVMVKLQ